MNPLDVGKESLCATGYDIRPHQLGEQPGQALVVQLHQPDHADSWYVFGMLSKTSYGR
jgi:hypothetical protein